MKNLVIKRKFFNFQKNINLIQLVFIIKIRFYEGLNMEYMFKGIEELISIEMI